MVYCSFPFLSGLPFVDTSQFSLRTRKYRDSQTSRNDLRTDQLHSIREAQLEHPAPEQRLVAVSVPPVCLLVLV